MLLFFKTLLTYVIIGQNRLGVQSAVKIFLLSFPQELIMPATD